MPWFVWVCLGIFLAALLPAMCIVVAAALRLFRAARSLGREIEPRAARLQAQSEELQRRSEHATYKGELTKARVAVLQASLGRVDVLLWALEDVRAFQRTVKSLMPRK